MEIGDVMDSKVHQTVANTLHLKSAREAVARALRTSRTLQKAIRDTNGSRPRMVAALADSLGIDRPPGGLKTIKP